MVTKVVVMLVKIQILLPRHSIVLTGLLVSVCLILLTNVAGAKLKVMQLMGLRLPLLFGVTALHQTEVINVLHQPQLVETGVL
jgi:hypothetical protein